MGRRPGLRVLAGASVLNAALGTLFAWSVLVPSVRDQLAASSADAAAVFSVALLSFTAAVLGAGRHVVRRRRQLLAACALLSAAGLLGAAAAGSVWLLALSFGGLFGAANGLGYAVAIAVAGERPPDQRGTALGIVVGAYAAGPIVVAPALGALVAAAGWRVGMVVLAALVVPTVVAAIGLLAPSTSAPAEASADGRVPPATIALLWLVMGAGTAPALMAFALATDLATGRGMTVAAAGLAVAVLSVGNLIGRLGAGWLSDRLDRRRVLVGLPAVLALTSAALAIRGSIAMLLVGLVVVGACYGGISAVTPAVTADLVGQQRLGSVYGRVFTAWGVAGLLGPVAGAWLQATTGSFTPVLWAGAAVAALAAAAAVRLARAPRRWA